MKTTHPITHSIRTPITGTILGVALLSALHNPLSTACAQGTAFTYQGRLNDGANPANGIYALRSSLLDSDNETALVVAGPLTNSPVVVSNGLFTVTLDFGAGAFDGSPRWLELGVRTNGAWTFTPLSPRQSVASTPYAIMAATVVSGGLAAGTYGNAVSLINANNQFAGNGGGLSNVNAATLGGVAPANFWQTGGNSNANAGWYLGTADNQPFEMRVNRARALRLLPGWNGWPNLIAGSSNNVINSDATAASIGGGAWNDIRSRSGSSVIGGGQRNWIGTNSAGAVIDGGQWNGLADGSVRGVIGGGYGNYIGGTTGTNAGSISGGITDGTSNTLLFEERNPGGAVIGGGTGNQIGRDCDSAVVAGGERNAIVGDGSVRTVGATIGGGVTNQIGSNAPCAVINGGRQNVVGRDAAAGVIGGGGWNSIQPDGVFGVIGGGYSNVIEGVPFLDGDAVVGDIADGTSNTLLIGETNVASGVIGGGYLNRIGYDSSAACIGGGGNNFVRPGAPYATIGGGNWNTNGGFGATIPGGVRNEASGDFSFAAGHRAKATNDGAFVWADAQDADFSSTRSNQFLIRAAGGVGIGTTNPVDSLHVEGGNSLRVRVATTGTGHAGVLSRNSLSEWFAGINTGSNYWAVYENSPYAGARLAVSSGGNVGIGTTGPTNKLHVAGGVSATAFVTTSDRNAKENFAPVSPLDVLHKVAALPIATWNFKDHRDGRHMGPMAQDFHAAFGLGSGDKTITTIDPDGVALAAIQGLNQKLEQKETEIAGLKEELIELKKLVNAMNHKLNGGGQ